MIKVYIPSPFYIPVQRQFPNPAKTVWGNCEFVFSEVDDYDYIVVIDSLKEKIQTTLSKTPSIIFLGEPPYVKSYNGKFLKQFGRVYGCHQKKVGNDSVKLSIPLLPWMVGCHLGENTHQCNSNKYLTYVDFQKNGNLHSRLNKICLITSNKTFTKGHRDRVRFVERILTEYPNLVDVYGNGYKSISDKWDILSRYKYSIVIENCSYPNYWTEKLADCFLAGCYPIYYGCTNINEYFSNDSMDTIDINNFKVAVHQLKAILLSSKYENSVNSMIESRNLVLNNYNMFCIISNIIENMEQFSSYKKERCNEIVSPMQYSIKDKVIQKIAWRLNIVL